jgi:hypothetical protein
MSNGVSNTVVVLVIQFGAIGVADCYIPYVIANDVFSIIDSQEERTSTLDRLDDCPEGNSEE